MNWKRPFSRKKSPVVAVLRLDGAIGASASRFRGSMLNMQSQAARIERAFKLKRLTALALVVNSPGGSPVQSALIAGRIRALAEEKDVPVLAFAEDVAASGGYWLACAADEIFVNEASIIGSIGVVSSGFGFQDLIARHGIERRVHTAGESKAILYPFLPEKPEDVARLKAVQVDIHEQFKTYVGARRGSRINASSEKLFSGAFWTGARAVELGLADGLGDIRSVLREKYGDEVRMIPIDAKKSMVRSLLGRTSMRTGMGSSMGDALSAMPEKTITALEERAIWARFGL
jgi:signal peptide peptidase SppA